jgi:hypothetical protein
MNSLIWCKATAQQHKSGELLHDQSPDLGRIAAAIPPDLVAQMLPDLESLSKFLDAERVPPSA